MKMRLIDADEINVKKWFVFPDNRKTMTEALAEAHTIDAVPVIRCKDCKHRGGYHCPMYHTETSLDDLDGFDEYTVDRTDGDGFCHRGERRE